MVIINEKNIIKKVKSNKSIRKHLFLCDICGKEKVGKKFPIFDENYNKQQGLVQCLDCFKD